MSQIDTEKNPKLFQFSKILCNFVTKTFDGLCGLERWNESTRKNLLSSRLFRRLSCSFLSENVSKGIQKREKTQNFPIFKLFMHFLLKFRQTSSIGMFQEVNEKKVDCPLVFEEFIAFLEMKLSQSDTRNDKYPKIFNFQRFRAFFPVFWRTLWIGTLKRVNK